MLVGGTALHVSLVRDTRQFGQRTIIAARYLATSMVLRPVDIMDVPCILVSAAAPASSTCLILIDLAIVALDVHGVATAH